MAGASGGGAVAVATKSRDVGGGLLTNKKFRAIVSQVVVLGLLVIFIAYIVNNTAANLEKRGIASGFGFLDGPAGFDVAFSVIDYNPRMSHGRVYLVGVANTVLVAFFGVIMATIIGFTVGVLRLSKNFMAHLMRTKLILKKNLIHLQISNIQEQKNLLLNKKIA